MKTSLRLLSGAALISSLAACSSMSSMMKAPDAPAAVAVPAGNKLVMMAVGAGDLTYECRVKAAMPGAYEWVFAGPTAVLSDQSGKAVGKYYAGPTWEANDGSKVTGKQLAVTPGAANAIPLQLVKANPSMGNGAMTDISYIQRLNTMGGIAPSDSCAAANVGAKKLVKYQADYYFYKAM
ncbi:DUF3455 domain-containing protein [Undibacterium sp. RTI2.1]|uniref:DUF3455 domain-containing protein n=1 Tax=unclassified Undibacterium TaxID=2630295 RepID=UPI002AB4E465|nr:MULTISPECIES: DUF3455 domain-containing protein [unclassified Undibacterium]MDY7538537.1 DUF3455 domain-containing protein [Undibacterium sp. 5I1]MEB0031919.1 DUF3455 domain-containing protein [Undibacterium sp. RTI2.1]MEB0116383.1 DUF3455 domain-containing protein [Undibacterium sp. RTI2.2]MEB0231865.1 DUF3455 domain-containing protein [Undibacterium sp. 10I3]MEB0258958.1 DUF3455 domain-containing protein [Undibacterium sp. 5I1]